MYLKRLELQGFKSFADKTIIDFEHGITGVVGPNGSGKSNISDAIKWVLGEQSAKTLRGGKMQDIIFAGASTRRPLGFAEVTLVMDNKDNAMKIDYSEVSITRRVFRSGESEYYINKTSCRLKDIKELFMDTGVGTDGYSIIGQGRIDEILSTKSEDRRNLFEEAAGIVKYKTRRLEAEKKLSRTNDNLIRINDIILELDKQIEPLKKQSEKAETYIQLTDELKDLEVNLFVREINRLNAQIKHLEEQKGLVKKQLGFNEGKRSDLEEKYESMKDQIESIDKSIEELQSLKQKTQNKLEKNDSDYKLSNEKLSFLNKEISRLKDEIEEIKLDMQSSEKESRDTQKQTQDLVQDINHLTEEIKGKKNAMNILLSRIKDTEKTIEEAKGSIIDYLNSMADRKGKINTIKSFNDNIDKRIIQLDKEVQDVKEKMDRSEGCLTQCGRDIEHVKKLLQTLMNHKSQTIEKITSMTKEIEDTENSLDQIKSDLQGSRSRFKLLNDMKEEYEGFYKGVRHALKASKKDPKLGQGIRGVVAELITVDKKHEKAIEIALGGSLQYIVVEMEQHARDIIEYLKKNKLGRVTFLPMSAISSKELRKNENKVLSIEGVIGVASDLIKYKGDYERIFKNLLGRVIIVDHIDTGIKVAKLCHHTLKIVSLDGEVLNPGGAMTGGSFKGNTTKLLGREREIKELHQKISQLTKQHNSKQKDKLVLKEALVQSNKNLKECENEIHDNNIELTNLQNKASKYEEEKERLKLEIEKSILEKEQLLKENKDSSTDIQKLNDELLQLQRDNDITQKKIGEMSKKYESEKQSKENISKEISDMRVQLASYEQKMKNLVQTKKAFIHRGESLNKSLIAKIEQCSKNEEDIKILRETCEDILTNREQLKEDLHEYETKLMETKNRKATIMETFYQHQGNLNEMIKTISDLEKSLNTLDVKQEKYNLQLEQFNNKLWEEYDLSYQMALKYQKDMNNVTKVQNEVRILKKNIKALGHINIDAIEEYGDVKERYGFMNNQKEDLINARESLNQVIKDMEGKMRRQFIENFDIIRENFKEVFSKLFGGGKADVYLSDEGDILNSGIEIIAQPPGKKLQSISLLSGGEKALTAISLLFAILKLKPTPFCVLDEIEAALDEANVHRYADYLQEFSHKTQFIVITHRKGTMESVNALYGVTMEEQGVSRLVSVKLSDKKNDEKAS